MNTDFLEKVVSNIFTNLLHTESQVTSAKVQAIAETSVHYALILHDTYNRVIFTKAEQVKEECSVVAKKFSEVVKETYSVSETVTEYVDSIEDEPCCPCGAVGAVDYPVEEEVEIVPVIKQKYKVVEKTTDNAPVKRGRGRPKGFSPKKKIQS